MATTNIQHTTAQRPFVVQQFLHFWSTLKRSGQEFFKGDPLTEASSLAFTTIFALPGVLILALMVASTFYDAAAVREALYGQAGSLIGASTANDLAGIVQKADKQKTGLFAQVLGLIALAVSASALFASLQNSLNRIWHVKQKPGKAIVRYLITRLTSLALISSFGFLLLVSLVVDAAVVAIGERIGAWLPASTMLVGAAGLVLSFAVVTTVFAMVFKFLPDMRVAWRTVWAGALFTALLFSGGKYLIGLYIAKSGAGDAYGAGGALIIIMLWVYYAAILTLFGAQFTYVTALHRGERMQPLPHAIKTATTK